MDVQENDHDTFWHQLICTKGIKKFTASGHQAEIQTHESYDITEEFNKLILNRTNRRPSL